MNNPFELKLLLDGEEFNHPIGWQNLTLSLERHADYKGVLFYTGSDLIFIDAAAHYVLNKVYRWEDIEVELRIVTNEDEKTILKGLINFNTVEIINFGSKQRVKVSVMKTDKWSKLISRKDVEVNILGDKIDGGTNPVLINTVYLNGIDIYFDYEVQDTFSNTTGSFTMGNPLYIMVKHTAKVDNVETVYDYGMDISNTSPYELRKYFLKARYSGTYQLTQNLVFSINGASSGMSFTIKWYYKINNNAPVLINTWNSAPSPLPTITAIHTLDYTWVLNEGDEVYFYGVLERTSGSVANFTFSNAVSGVFGDFKLRARTNYPARAIQSLTLRDCIRYCVNVLVGKGILNVYPDMPAVSYLVTRGKNMRGFDFSTFPFVHSFSKLFDPLVFMLNLGMWFNDDDDKIVIEPVDNLYKNSIGYETIGNLDSTIKIDNALTQQLKLGYNNYESEFPLTAGNTNFHGWVSLSITKKIGNNVQKMSDYIASSLVIEEYRRSTEGSVDKRYDERVFIFENSPDINIANSSLRPSACFIRSLKQFNQHGEQFFQVGKEGVVPYFETEPQTYHSGFVINTKIKMNYDEFRYLSENRHKIIKIGDYEVFLKKLDFRIFAGEATIEGHIINAERYGFSLGYSTGFNA